MLGVTEAKGSDRGREEGPWPRARWMDRVKEMTQWVAKAVLGVPQQSEYGWSGR